MFGGSCFCSTSTQSEPLEFHFAIHRIPLVYTIGTVRNKALVIHMSYGNIACLRRKELPNREKGCSLIRVIFLGSGVKAHYMGAKNVVTLYCFPWVSMFELQPW
jgi:hypothetical protein